MTPSEMEHEIRNLNVWVEEVRQNLQLVATKQDVHAATDSLRNELLSELATKEFVLNLIKATRGESGKLIRKSPPWLRMSKRLPNRSRLSVRN